MSWRKALYNLAVSIEEQVSAWKYRYDRRFHADDKIKIVPYLGYGTRRVMQVKGRVLYAKEIGLTPDDSVWVNLRNMYRRFESDEIPYMPVAARFGGQQVDGVTDDEGYFDLTFALETPPPADKLWHPVRLSLPTADQVVQARGRVLVPPVRAQFGVISDIDDTVLQTNATSLLRMLRVVFFNNAHTRLPFEGVAAFYRALRGECNPIFYVSSSPWNLYDLLIDFFRIQDIPSGPLFLRDFGLSRQLPRGHHGHKLAQIEKIMSLYPEMQFILIGDSGQHDPEIYQHAVKEYPGRVLAIYIRDVSQTGRDAEVESIIEDVYHTVPMVLAADTLVAARHAVAQGYIEAAALDEIQTDMASRPATLL